MADKELDVWRETEADFRKLEAELTEARAAIAKLREALTDIGSSGPVDEHGQADGYAGWSWCYERANKALAATPSDCYAQIRAEVLEDVAGHFGNDPQQQWSGFLVALEVRDMKDKP